MKNILISSKELNSELKNPNLIILDVSQKPSKSYIKGAHYFDLKNEFSDSACKFPNTLPSPIQFEESCQKLGLNNSSKIVVYDNVGIFNSPRVWWMFKTMGHENVSILDGGLPDWIKEGLETTSDYFSPALKGDFKASFHPESVIDYKFILENSKNPNALVIDARSEGRFSGIAPEPREGLHSGNIPNSINLPYTDVLKNGKFKSKDELSEIFKSIKDNESEIVFSCGSGVTACILLAASELVFEHTKSVYDGSWTEWAIKQNLID